MLCTAVLVLNCSQFEAFAAMSSHVSCAMSLLAKYKGQPQKLADEVDRVLSTCVREASANTDDSSMSH